MKRVLRVVASVLLVSLAVALGLGIVSMYDWGGRIETILLVFGDPVWVTIDVARPRFLVLLLIPGIFAGAALSLHAWRASE